MRALATTLVLVATTAAAAPPGDAGVDTSPAPALAAPAAAAPVAAPAQPAPAPGATAERPPASVVPTQAVIDRLGQGDRLLLEGDRRGALFAYQDAVYAQPGYAPARVRLGRAYLALRYPDFAIAQAEEALAVDPASAEARKLLEEARAAPPRPTVAAPAAAPAGARVFKLSPEPEGEPVRIPAAATAGGAAGSAGIAAPVPVAGGAAAPAAGAAAVAGAAAAGPPSAAQKQAAAQHYRTALGFLQRRDWTSAVAALSDAILADPTLAVAYSARGSAQFGLRKYRDAAEDYSAAMRLNPRLGTPVYGLAECYRVLGDGKRAAELYERYAHSGAADVRDDLRALATRRAQELR